MNYWPKDLDPKGYTPEQRQFIKINERTRQLEARVKLLEEGKR